MTSPLVPPGAEWFVDRAIATTGVADPSPRPSPRTRGEGAALEEAGAADPSPRPFSQGGALAGAQLAQPGPWPCAGTREEGWNQEVALALIDLTTIARLAVGRFRAWVDGAALLNEAPAWRTRDDARESLIESMRADSGAPVPADALADYLVTCWIFHHVWAFPIRERPADRLLPPNYDADAKRTLASAVRSDLHSIDLDFDRPDTVLREASSWTWVSDVRSTVLKHAGRPPAGSRAD